MKPSNILPSHYEYCWRQRLLKELHQNVPENSERKRSDVLEKLTKKGVTYKIVKGFNSKIKNYSLNVTI